jgi:CheY-like chemotaxis protein
VRTKVLIAEDYTDVRKMMGIMLRQYGYDVIEAADGYEAVEKALSEHPDMILMDLAMPILDGINATRALRSHDEFADTPIVAITAYQDFYREQAKAAGCNEVIQKPVDFEKLQPLVNRYSN